MSGGTGFILADILFSYRTTSVISLIFRQFLVDSSTSACFWQGPFWVILFITRIRTCFRYISSWPNSFGSRCLIDQTVLSPLSPSIPERILFGVCSVRLLSNLIIWPRSFRKRGNGESGLSSNFWSESFSLPCMVCFYGVVDKPVILVKVIFRLYGGVLGRSSKSKI